MHFSSKRKETYNQVTIWIKPEDTAQSKPDIKDFMIPLINGI